MPGLGIYPTVESLLAQSVLLVLLLAALFWTFVVEPRRAGRVSAAALGGRATNSPPVTTLN